MLLINDKSKFKLEIVKYAYENSTDFYDSNWLSVKVDVLNGNESWQSIGTYLLTIEIFWLRNWLTDLLNDELPAELSFIENELSFSCELNNTKLINIKLFGEVHPKGMLFDYGSDTTFNLSFLCTNSHISKLIDDCDLLLALFPIRGEVPTRYKGIGHLKRYNT